jgi:hypothetical protein
MAPFLVLVLVLGLELVLVLVVVPMANIFIDAVVCLYLVRLLGVISCLYLLHLLFDGCVGVGVCI